MTYTPDIPKSGESLGGTRARINTNFQQIDAVFGENHVTFNASGEGKHKFLQMPEQSSAPTTAADELGFYCKEDPNPGSYATESVLFFRGESDGNEYQLTKSIEAESSEFGENNSYGSPPAGFVQTGGWTFLPGGLILQYGVYGKALDTGTSGVIQFPIDFPNNVFSLTCTLTGPINGNVAPFSITTSQFAFGTSNGGATGVYWQAIGN